MYTVFLLALSSAQQSIHITNPYFVPDEKMITTLLDAVRRGVRVVLLIPGAIDHHLVRHSRRPISITQPASLRDETMSTTLLGAVRRGVRVVLLIPGAIAHTLVRRAS